MILLVFCSHFTRKYILIVIKFGENFLSVTSQVFWSTDHHSLKVTSGTFSNFFFFFVSALQRRYRNHSSSGLTPFPGKVGKLMINDTLLSTFTTRNFLLFMNICDQRGNTKHREATGLVSSRVMLLYKHKQTQVHVSLVAYTSLTHRRVPNVVYL